MSEETGQQLKAERADCVIITAPHWFAREDFLRWLRLPGAATWDGGAGTDYSDTFLTFDAGDDPGADGAHIMGSDFGAEGDRAMPADIEREIKRALAGLAVARGVVWLRPV